MRESRACGAPRSGHVGRVVFLAAVSCLGCGDSRLRSPQPDGPAREAAPADRGASDGGVCTLTSVNDGEVGVGPSSFSYSGTWGTSSDPAKYQQDDHYSSTTGDAVVISFRGTSIALFGAKAAWHGIAAVSLDDGPEVDADCYAATREDQARLYASATLPDGVHRLKVRVSGRKNPASTGTTVAVDRVDVCVTAAPIGDGGRPDQRTMTATMTVQGTQLRDRCGEAVVLRGVNSGIAFPNDPQAKNLAQVSQTGANAVRLTFRVQYDNSSAQDVDLALGEAFKQKLIAIPSVWDATGDWSKLGFCTDFWLKPDMVAVLKKHEAYTLLNIANEAGATVTDAEFVQGYTQAVQKLRQAGLHMPLVIDAAGWGRTESYLINNGPSLLQQDPDHNLLFSWHPWDESQPASRYQKAFDDSIAKGICLIVGEFSSVGVNFDKPIDYRSIMQLAQQKQIGWLWWWWTGGDGHALTADGVFGNWANVGEEVCVSSASGIKNTAKRTTYFQTGGCK